MSANIALGFVKDAKSHVNIQGYSVYHKNRLIKVHCYSINRWSTCHDF